MTHKGRAVWSFKIFALWTQFHVYKPWGAFNQEKALVGAFFVIVKTDCETDGSFYSTNCDHHVVLPLPTLCLASEAKSPKSKSKIENKIFPCLCQKDTRGNLRLPIVFFSPSLWRLINCYAVFVGGFESWAPQVVLLRG